MRTSEIAQKEIQEVEVLIVEGSRRLANTIEKHDFKEASVASALIDGVRKKIEKAKTEGDCNIKMRKDIDERKGKMIDHQIHRKKPKSRTVFCWL